MRLLVISEYAPDVLGTGPHLRTHQIVTTASQFAEVDFVLCNIRGTTVRSSSLSRCTVKGEVRLNARRLVFRGSPWFWRWKFTNNMAVVGMLYRLSDLIAYRRIEGARRELESIVDLGSYDRVIVRYLECAMWFELLDLKNLILDCDDCRLESMVTFARSEKCNRLDRLVKATAYIWNRKRFREMTAHVHTVLYSGGTLLPWRENYILYANKMYSKKIVSYKEPRSKNLLFVGTLSYAPNLTGLRWFIKYVFRGLRQRFPRVTLNVVGPGLRSSDWDELKREDGIVLSGYVPQLEECYAECIATIAPVFVGSGTSIKVMESIAQNRFVMCSPFAARGYSAMQGPNGSVLVCSNADEYHANYEMLVNLRDNYRKRTQKTLELLRSKYVFDDEVVDEDMRSILARNCVEI